MVWLESPHYLPHSLDCKFLMTLTFGAAAFVHLHYGVVKA